MRCPLCLSSQTTFYFEDQKRKWLYWLCQDCDYVFRDPKSLLSAVQEKARYETHNNSIENSGYVKFLLPVVETLRPVLKSGDRGLDFGSGPGPILDILFARQGLVVQNYDPYFAPLELADLESFDFITCTEVFEHFYQPHQELKSMTRLLKSGGHLVIMTQFRDSLEHFKGWGYRMDNTHVGFLNSKSLSWLAQNWGYDILSVQDRVSLLRRHSTDI